MPAIASLPGPVWTSSPSRSCTSTRSALLLGLSVGLYFAARAVGSPGRAAQAAGILIAVEIAQGAVGVVQYALDLPVLLVGLHLLGAALLVAAVVDAWFAARWLPEPAPSPRVRHPRP